MMKNLVMIAFVIVCAFAMTAHSQQEVGTNVSMIELIANPDRFNGKPVLVRGYLRLEHEGDVLYLSETDFLHGIPKNGLWVERSPEMTRDIEKLDSNYVLVLGIFNPRNKGHRSLASGSIEKVRSCTLWSKTKEPIALRLRESK